MLAFAGGQPLALTLAADLATQREFAPEDWRPNQEIVKTLLHSLVGRVPTLAHRQALEVCAHVEVTTEELLRSALGDCAADLFDWLRGLPFIECGRYGVYPHDVVRDVLTQDLRWRDPEGYGLLHRSIHDHLLGEVRAAAGSDVIEKTRSLLYLYRHASSVANYLTWTGRGEVYEADYLPEDRAAVLRLTSECEGAESARIAAFWLDRQPDAFHLQRRSETGEIVAFSAWLRLHGPEPDEIAADPVIAAAWRHCDTFGPTRPGEHIAVSRFTIDANAYGSTSPAVDLMIARVMAEWLRAHRIAWSFLVYLDIEAWDTQAKSVEHQPISERVTVNGRELLLYGHDWRTAPLRLWLSQQETEVLSGRRPNAPAQPIVRCLAPPPIRYRGTRGAATHRPRRRTRSKPPVRHRLGRYRPCTAQTADRSRPHAGRRSPRHQGVRRGAHHVLPAGTHTGSRGRTARPSVQHLPPTPRQRDRTGLRIPVGSRAEREQAPNRLDRSGTGRPSLRHPLGTH